MSTFGMDQNSDSRKTSIFDWTIQLVQSLYTYGLYPARSFLGCHYLCWGSLFWECHCAYLGPGERFEMLWSLDQWPVVILKQMNWIIIYHQTKSNKYSTAAHKLLPTSLRRISFGRCIAYYVKLGWRYQRLVYQLCSVLAEHLIYPLAHSKRLQGAKGSVRAAPTVSFMGVSRSMNIVMNSHGSHC